MDTGSRSKIISANTPKQTSPTVTAPNALKSCWKRRLEIPGLSTQGALKNGAGTASSPRFVNGPAFYGDGPSPPLLAHFLERTLPALTRPNQERSADSLVRVFFWHQFQFARTRLSALLSPPLLESTRLFSSGT